MQCLVVNQSLKTEQLQPRVLSVVTRDVLLDDCIAVVVINGKDARDPVVCKELGCLRDDVKQVEVLLSNKY